MANEKYKPQIPDIMEAIFDAGYLIFDLIAGILFFAFSKGNPLFILYGVLTLTHSTLFRELSEQFTVATTKSKGNSVSACRFPQSQ